MSPASEDVADVPESDDELQAPSIAARSAAAAGTITTNRETFMRRTLPFLAREIDSELAPDAIARFDAPVMQKHLHLAGILIATLAAAPVACSSSSSTGGNTGGGDSGTTGGDGGGSKGDAASGGDSGSGGDAGGGCVPVGAPGNDKGVGKYCQTFNDCTVGQANLCAIIGGATDDFCTFFCDPEGGTDQCGANATCQCQGGQCGCTPDSCM